MPAAAFKSLRFPKSEPYWAHSLAHSLLQNLLFFLRKVAYAPFNLQGSEEAGGGLQIIALS